jgi:hypothetical protein
MPQSIDIEKLAMPCMIVANGVCYLGTVTETEKKVTIDNALPLGSPSQISGDHLADYLCAAYSGKLTKTNIGLNTAWSTTDLDGELAINWQIAKLRLDQAIKTAPINTVLQTFRYLRG